MIQYPKINDALGTVNRGATVQSPPVERASAQVLG
jgi:hypothetical protein